MGCGCKQNTITNKPVIKKENNINVVAAFAPNYTREEITRVKDFLIARNKTNEEENWVIDFHNKHFQEQLPHGYKGDGWLRLRNRIAHLDQQLIAYENSQKTN